MMAEGSRRDRIAALMETFCTRDEVAAALAVAPDALDGIVREEFAAEFGGEATYEDVQARHHAIGRARLHRAQFDAALDGDRSMLLALGREYLGQGEGGAPDGAARTSEGTVLALVQGRYADSPNRKSRAAH